MPGHIQNLFVVPGTYKEWRAGCVRMYLYRLTGVPVYPCTPVIWSGSEFRRLLQIWIFCKNSSAKWLGNSVFLWNDTEIAHTCAFFEKVAQELLRGTYACYEEFTQKLLRFKKKKYQDLWWNDAGITWNFAFLEKIAQKKTRNSLWNYTG